MEARQTVQSVSCRLKPIGLADLQVRLPSGRSVKLKAQTKHVVAGECRVCGRGFNSRHLHQSFERSSMDVDRIIPD